MKKIHIVSPILILLLAGHSLGQEVGSGEGSGDTLEAGSGAAEVSEVVEASVSLRSKAWKITTEDFRVIQAFEFSFIFMFRKKKFFGYNHEISY